MKNISKMIEENIPFYEISNKINEKKNNNDEKFDNIPDEKALYN
jgi:hypothetical protein